MISHFKQNNIDINNCNIYNVFGDFMKKGKKVVIIVIAVIIAIILALVSTFFILTHIGKSQFHKDDTHISTDAVEIEDESTITYGDSKYTLNPNIVSVLVIGIDRDNINQNYGSGKNGQADVIFIAAINTKTKKTSIIPISRETMVDVNLYTADGNYAGANREQLCLAYAYGNTTEESCKNVLTSVRRLLYGINISSYLAMELKGISSLTDLAGGVELTSLEDIITKPLTASKGQKIKLDGIKAAAYIQYRGDDTEANTRRMARQKQFLSALMNKTGNAILDDFSNLSKFYNTLTPYFSTNVSFAQITYLAKNCLTLNFGDALDYKTIEGTLAQGEEWIEFEADEESVLQAVIDVFYIPKE